MARNISFFLLKRVVVFSWVLSTVFSMFEVPVFAVDTSVSVSPLGLTEHRGDVFSVNVTLTNVSCLCGWEFKLYWNRTMLNCTLAELRVPDAWSGWNNSYLEAGKGLQNDFNATHGRYWKAITGALPAPVLNGSMTLVAFTFEALNLGVTTLHLQDVKLADTDAFEIPNVDFDGSVTVTRLPLYMRTDLQTVNGATMYRLAESHTTTSNSTSRSVFDPEYEAMCFWGVRVWKRSDSGTEIELTGGSPVAVVSRSSSGSGIQSASWNCTAISLNVTDSLVVRVYYKTDFDSGYTLSSQFTTSQLNATSLSAQAWTIYYYTSRSYNSQQHRTYIYYYWDNGYSSKIENLNYN